MPVPPADPDPALRPDPRRVTRLAAYGLIERDGSFLLCRVGPGNLGEGRWTLPGGGLEFGEAPEVAVVREVEEETGLVAEISGPPMILSHTGDWDLASETVRYHHVRFVYPMSVTGGAERLEVGGSTDAFGWFNRAEVDELRVADRLGDVTAELIARP
jgi:8-oxo-dGTP diphosphatase